MNKRFYIWLLAVMALLAVFASPPSVRADGETVVINEVQGGMNKAIEYYNPGINPVDLSVELYTSQLCQLDIAYQ